MSGSCESSVAQVSNIKSVETWAALGCCIDSETGPASINKPSPHSAGGCVVKGVLVPVCKDVEEMTPARSSAKEEFGEISAVERGFRIEGPEWWSTGAAIVGECRDIVVLCRHGRIYRKSQSDIPRAVANHSKLASLLLYL